MVAIYVRLSDEDRNKKEETDESESIQNQKTMLRDYCVERNWEIYDIYCDEDYSGTEFNRPDFQRMLKDCENGKVDIVLCKSQSRFSRDITVIETYLHDKFIEWQIRFVSVVDRADTNDTANKKTRQLNGLVNMWYCEETSDNIRRVLQNKRKNGQFTGSFAPYGYLVDPNDKNHLIVDENTAPVVQDIFKWYNSGWGYRRIVMQLNELGLPNPTTYKQQLGLKYVNKLENASYAKGLWTHSTIYRIIRNETYTGTLVQGKSHDVSYKNHKRKRVAEKDWIKVPDSHEAIIDEKTWLTTQTRLTSKVRVDKITQEQSPLSGKVICAVCGTAMKRNVYYNKKKTIKYYSLKCGTYISGAMNCTNTAGMSGKELEKLICEQINELIDNYCQFDKLEIKNKQSGKIQALENNISQFEDNIEKNQNRISGLYEDKLDGIVTLEQFKILTARYESEINNLKDKIASTKSKIKEINTVSSELMNKQAVIKKYSHINKLTRPVVEEFIDSIEIGEKIEGKERKIIINWNI